MEVHCIYSSVILILNLNSILDFKMWKDHILSTLTSTKILAITVLSLSIKCPGMALIVTISASHTTRCVGTGSSVEVPPPHWWESLLEDGHLAFANINNCNVQFPVSLV